MNDAGDLERIAAELTRDMLNAKSHIGLAGAQAKVNHLNLADQAVVFASSLGHLVAIVHAAERSGSVAARAIDDMKRRL